MAGDSVARREIQQHVEVDSREAEIIGSARGVAGPARTVAGGELHTPQVREVVGVTAAEGDTVIEARSAARERRVGEAVAEQLTCIDLHILRAGAHLRARELRACGYEHRDDT